jgi:hypothetical protein
MCCGNTTWIFMPTDFTKQPPLWTLRQILLPDKILGDAQHLQKIWLKLNALLHHWMDIHIYGLHYAICWLILRQKCPWQNFEQHTIFTEKHALKFPYNVAITQSTLCLTKLRRSKFYQGQIHVFFSGISCLQIQAYKLCHGANYVTTYLQSSYHNQSDIT